MEDQLNNPSQSLSVDEAKAAAANQGMGCDIASDSNLTLYFVSPGVPNSFLFTSGSLFGGSLYCYALNAVDVGLTGPVPSIACNIVMAYFSYATYAMWQQAKLAEQASIRTKIDGLEQIINNDSC